MNTRTKIAIGIVGGLVAGATLVGTAFAAPAVMTAVTGSSYGMMGAYRTVASTSVPTFADMQRFMDTYRTPDGRLDVTRMHADVTSGKVAPPCANVTSGTGAAAPSPGGRRGVGYGMMGRTY
jgi:hypothetical protein